MAIELQPVEDNSERIAELEAKLKARRNKRGMEANCEAIEAEIARLKGE